MHDETQENRYKREREQRSVIDDIQDDAHVAMMTKSSLFDVNAADATGCTKARHSSSSTGESSTPNHSYVDKQEQCDNNIASGVFVGGTWQPRNTLLGKLHSNGSGRRARTVPPVPFPTMRSLRLN